MSALDDLAAAKAYLDWKNQDAISKDPNSAIASAMQDNGGFLGGNLDPRANYTQSGFGGYSKNPSITDYINNFNSFAMAPTQAAQAQIAALTQQERDQAANALFPEGRTQFAGAADKAIDDYLQNQRQFGSEGKFGGIESQIAGLQGQKELRPGVYSNPNQTMEQALANYNAGSIDIDPRWINEIAHAQQYFHGDATFAPGTQWANPNTLRSAEAQWQRDAEPSGFDKFMGSVIDLAPSAILGFAGGPALAGALGGGTAGAVGAGAITGGLSSAAQGGDILKGALMGGLGGGIGGYTQGLDQTVGSLGLSQAQLANAVAKGGLSALTGGNPLAASLGSLGGSAVGNMDIGGSGSFLDQQLPQLASAGIKAALTDTPNRPSTFIPYSMANQGYNDHQWQQMPQMSQFGVPQEEQAKASSTPRVFTPSDYFNTSRYFG